MSVLRFANKVIGIGWDVGGWMGRKQGFSICLWDKNQHTFEWLGEPMQSSLPNNKIISPNDIFEMLLNYKVEEFVLDHSEIVIGIDAPLGYPRKFTDFINGSNVFEHKPISEIMNPMAYRETERHIYNVFSKKPLSAAYDKIGNNATVAISHIREWVINYGYIVQPSYNIGTKNIIEVYPALIKENVEYYKRFDGLIPYKVNRKSDAYDSSICAIMALKYYVGEDLLGIPKVFILDKFEDYVDEGWIYYIK